MPAGLDWEVPFAFPFESAWRLQIGPWASDLLSLPACHVHLQDAVGFALI